MFDQNELRNMPIDELKRFYSFTSVRKSVMFQTYRFAADEFGSDNEVVQYLWNEYEQFERDSNIVSVTWSQRSMQAQYDAMTPEEFSSYRQQFS